MYKKIFLIGIMLTSILYGYAQYDKIIMHSNKKNIVFFVNEGQNSWTITPEIKPDVYKIYHETVKSYYMKFISDIDSLEFNVEVNKPVYFSIIYNGDTAYTAIEFTNYIPNSLSDEEKLYGLSLCWSEIKYNFAFIEKIKFDIDSLYKKFMPKVLATKNDYEYQKQIALFIGKFKDGHTTVGFSGLGRYTDYISMETRYFDNELYIVCAREDLAKIYPIGSKIIEINDLPTAEYMKQYVEPYIASDFEPRVKTSAAYRLFANDLSSNKIKIKYETPDKKILVNTPPRDANSVDGEIVGYIQKYPTQRIELNWKENIAILGFHSFSARDDEVLIRAFEKLKDTLYSAKGIIIDLRQNGGGSTDVGRHLLKYIVKEPYFLGFGSHTRINNGIKKANGNWIEKYEDFYKYRAYETWLPDTIYISDTIKKFNVPIVVLISNYTFSAAEDFLIDLYEIPGRPLIIGQPSGGSTGSPSVIWDFPGKGSVRVCARKVLFPYSLKPFLEGIQPDILVNYSFEEFMSGKDKDIEVAIKELQKQINNQSSK